MTHGELQHMPSRARKTALRAAYPLALTLAACSAVWCAEFSEDFAAARGELWRLSAGGAARAVIADGRLLLDMRTPAAGKWAVATLKRAISLPAKVTWRQRLVHDSRFAWFSGIVVRSAPFGLREHVAAGLGGRAMRNAVFLGAERGQPGAVRPLAWYRLVLELDAAAQRLTVIEEATGKTVASLQTHAGLVHGPFVVSAFHNDPRTGPSRPDTFAQDRGAAEFDDLHITAAKIAPYTPPPPGTTYPYKIPVVFNRAMKWVTSRQGLTRGCIAYDGCRWLALTGRRAVSRWLELDRWQIREPGWFPPQPNIRALDARRTLFRLRQGKNSATFVLRALQWNLDQHPTIKWRARATGLRWRLEITATDGVRPFTWKLYRSPWFSPGAQGRDDGGDEGRAQKRDESGDERPFIGGSPASADVAAAGPGAGEVDVARLYRAGGWPNRYAEADIAVHLERLGPGDGELVLEMGMDGRPAVVPRWPVVARVAEARDRGVVIEAIVADERGRLADAAEVVALVAGRRVVMSRAGGSPVYRATVAGLETGIHRAVITARAGGRSLRPATLTVAVTDMEFADHYDRRRRSYCTASGRALGPLVGDLLAWVPVVDVNTPRRRPVLGLADLQQVSGRGGAVAYTKWRVLPRPMIDRYVDYMARCGVSVLRLTVNVSPAEYYLDACGHVAPHGLEQVAYILAAARRNNIRCVLNITHYPYLWPGTGNNPPVMQYFEAGYKKRFGWTSDEMWSYLSGYLRELLGFTGQDPAVIAYTITGENDQSFPAEWINRAWAAIKRLAPRQMVVLEQGGSIKHCRGRDPASYRDYKPAGDGGVGYRTYNTYRYRTDCYMAVAARFFDLSPPSFLGEVACGVNTWPWFQIKLRDAMGLALTLQQPMAISWSAPLVECQRKAIARAARMIDWSAFRRARPPVAVVVERPDDEQIRRMVAYEEALATMAVDYCYIRPDDDRAGYLAVYDARRPSVELEATGLPEQVLGAAPMSVSAGNHVTYALSDDRRWMVAYVRNATHYELKACDVGRMVELCRLPDRPRRVVIRLRKLAEGLEYVVIDAATAHVVRRGCPAAGACIDLGQTTADYLVVVRPQGAAGRATWGAGEGSGDL